MISFKHLLTSLLFIFLIAQVSPAFSQVNNLKSSETTVSAQPNGRAAQENVTDHSKESVKLTGRFAYSLGLDLAAMLIIFGLIYFPNYRNKEFMFTFFLFNIIIFIITFVLNKTSISMGAAFGLFAVFSMLRYRTEGISMKEMTYLLITIALGLINAIGLDVFPISVFNLIFILFIFILDHPAVFKQEVSKSIIYENIELIRPEDSQLLLEDLRKRTGINIHRFTITSIDFLKDATSINIFYYKK